jgi:hypothetical protein
MASFGRSAILAAEPSAAGSPPAITSATTPSPDFESLRVKGLNIALPGPQDTIDPDFAGIRSSLAAIGIGYIGYSSNSFYDNMLSAERTTFGNQAYNGQKPTFFTNNVMQLTYDLSRYGIPDGQIVLGGVYNFDTWAPAGPNALSLATFSYYQTFLNKRVELKFGYLANAVEFWGPFLAGNLAASIFGPSANIPVELGINAWAWATPAINIKVNGPDGFYDKLGIQRASSPDGPSVEKIDNPTNLKWSTPNSGVLVINEFGYRTEAAPGQLATWCVLRQCSTTADTLITHLAVGAPAITQGTFWPINKSSNSCRWQVRLQGAAAHIQIQQVILNLVKNAIEAMRSGSSGNRRLRLVTGFDGKSSVSVYIQDSGGGIACAEECPLSGVKQTSKFKSVTSAFDPKRT